MNPINPIVIGIISIQHDDMRIIRIAIQSNDGNSWTTGIQLFKIITYINPVKEQVSNTRIDSFILN